VKKTYLIAWLVLFASGTLWAQTNVAAVPKPPRAPTRIDSDSADFDLTARRAVYLGNVRVDDPQMKLTCEKLIADLPQSGGHINHLVALTNVVMDSVDDKGQTNHATCDKAVYDYNVENGVTNETVTLTGHAEVENAQGWLTGEPIFWDRINNHIHAKNEKMLFRQNIQQVMANTNSPTAKTNFPPGTILQPALTNTFPKGATNFPPGTIQNIDRIKGPPAHSF
jgi:lipopolysaccharide transport protein LptA